MAQVAIVASACAVRLLHMARSLAPISVMRGLDLLVTSTVSNRPAALAQDIDYCTQLMRTL